MGMEYIDLVWSILGSGSGVSMYIHDNRNWQEVCILEALPCRVIHGFRQNGEQLNRLLRSWLRPIVTERGLVADFDQILQNHCCSNVKSLNNEPHTFVVVQYHFLHKESDSALCFIFVCFLFQVPRLLCLVKRLYLFFIIHLIINSGEEYVS